MRILFCNYEYPPLGGGGGVANALLAEEMAKKHEVTVLTSQAFGLPRESIENGVRVVRVPVLLRRRRSVASMPSMLSFAPMSIPAGLKLVKEQQFDIINSHFVVPSAPTGAFLSRYGKIPHVITVIGGDLYDPSKRYSPHRYALVRTLIGNLLRRADAVVGISNDTLEKMHTFYAPDLKGHVVSLAIQPLRTLAINGRQVYRGDYGFDNDAVLLITIGRLVARKAVTQLIKMMDKFNGERVHLLIVGSGPMEEQLKREVALYNLSEQVHFMGAVWGTPKFQLLRMSDLYVSTSEHEGFGLVFLEAMASGLPIVCYDNGGQTDFLVNGRNGYLLQLNDLGQFTESCRLLIDNRDQRRRIGNYNEIYVQDYFIDAIARKYERIFETAINSRLKAAAFEVYERIV